MVTLREVLSTIDLGREFILLFDPGAGFKREFEFLCKAIGNGICIDQGIKKNEAHVKLFGNPEENLGPEGQKAFYELCALLNKPRNL